jgi:hypothetical protein
VCEEGVRSEANGLKCDSICFSLEIFAAFIPVLSSLISAVSTRNPFRLPGTPNSSLVRSYTGRAVLQGWETARKGPAWAFFRVSRMPTPSVNKQRCSRRHRQKDEAEWSSLFNRARELASTGPLQHFRIDLYHSSNGQFKSSSSMSTPRRNMQSQSG